MSPYLKSVLDKYCVGRLDLHKYWKASVRERHFTSCMKLHTFCTSRDIIFYFSTRCFSTVNVLSKNRSEITWFKFSTNLQTKSYISWRLKNDNFSKMIYNSCPEMALQDLIKPIRSASRTNSKGFIFLLSMKSISFYRTANSTVLEESKIIWPVADGVNECPGLECFSSFSSKWYTFSKNF